MPNFDVIYNEYFEKVEFLIDELSVERFKIDKTSRYYSICQDLSYILKDKTFLRKYKLSLIGV